jgi:hypothetical protein
MMAHQNLPIAEFITTSHTIDSISLNLNIIKNIFSKHITEKKLIAISPLIVMDHSWALISSILLSFNKTNALTYLQWMFEIFKKRKLKKKIILKRKFTFVLLIC